MFFYEVKNEDGFTIAQSESFMEAQRIATKKKATSIDKIKADNGAFVNLGEVWSK